MAQHYKGKDRCQHGVTKIKKSGNRYPCRRKARVEGLCKEHLQLAVQK